MNVLNIGSVNIDHVYQVPHFPQPGETLASAGYGRFPGGKGFNQSVALARAGSRVWHAGHVGEEGAWLVDFLRAEGVDTSLLTPVDGPTGHAVIEVAPSGQNRILIEGGANRRLTADDVREAVERSGVGPGDVVLLQNETSATADILRIGAASGAKVAFNTAPISDDLGSLPLECVGLFIVNEIEGAALCGAEPGTPGPELLARLRRRFPAADILLTLGADGSLFGAAGDAADPVQVPARRVQAVDTTAAGDTFTGYFLAAAGAGLDARHCLDRATAAAAIGVSRPGAAPSIPYAAEVDAALR